MTDPINLQRRTLYKVLQLFIFVFGLIALISILALDGQTRKNAQDNLLVRKQVIEEVFNNYLTRAEYEMGYISQELVLSNYQKGDELEELFSHHEVLFFGGLDFFYIDWQNREGAIDPRARVFTQESLASLISVGRINRWVKVVTKDGAVLLMYKKKLISKDRRLVGYLYGFISLNNNLTLSSELLDGAKADLIQLYDSHTGSLLLKESKVDFDPSDSLVSIMGDLVSPVENSQLKISITKRVPITNTIVSTWLRVLLFVFLVFVALYACVVWLIRRLIFVPLVNIVQQVEGHHTVYSELQPIQEKSAEYQSLLYAKEQRFQLLLESTHSAIIFCNEMAEIESINREAQHLFPQQEHSRTIFDFMPISCHQSIQEVLKGGVGVSFELTLAHINGIYHWQAYSFPNEGGFRSIVLIGRDTTQERRLAWQLEQLRSSTLDVHQRLDVDILLHEMSQLTKRPLYASHSYVRGWMSLLLETLSVLRGDSGSVETLSSVGTLLGDESDLVIRELGIASETVQIECDVFVGTLVLTDNAQIRSLLRLAIMAVVANEMPEKRLTLTFDHTDLEISISSGMPTQGVIQWSVVALLKQLGGHLQKRQNNALTIRVPIEGGFCEFDTQVMGMPVVAWVVNDYPHPEIISESLKRLGAKIEIYDSNDSFFMQASTVKQFDTIVVGCHNNSDVLFSAVNGLRVRHKNHKELPVIWLNGTLEDATNYDVLAIQGYPFDYNLKAALIASCQREALVPNYLSETEVAWVLVGGSRVTKAIWYTELEKRSILSQWLPGLSDGDAILSRHPNAVIVLLEPQPTYLLRRMMSRYSDVKVFSVQTWADCPDNVILFEISPPYTGEQISALEEFVRCHTNI